MCPGGPEAPSCRPKARGKSLPAGRTAGRAGLRRRHLRSAGFPVVYSSAPDRRVFKSRVHAQMWLKNPDKSLRAADTLSSTQNDMYHKLHHHGPAFESEYAAYRIYFDNKQTIDTYGKKRPRLELAETMWYPSDEQLAAGYGHDNLRVFGSVGVGTLKGWDAGKRKMVPSPISDAARPAYWPRPRPHDRRDAGRRVEIRRPRDRHDFALHPLRRTQRRAG